MFSSPLVPLFFANPNFEGQVKKNKKKTTDSMDGDENYDEFGNYVGPDLDSDESSDDDYANQDDSRRTGMGAANQAAMELQNDDLDGAMMELAVSNPEAAAEARASFLAAGTTASQSAIVLAEDKQYYPDASEVYGEDVETLVEEGDAQPLTKPIIAPLRKVNASTVGENADQMIAGTTYDSEFLVNLLNHPQLIRNVAIVGHLHSGKTSLCDMLVEQTRMNHEGEWPLGEQKRYTDTRLDEQHRGMSIKSCPISLVLPTSVGKSYLMNVIDCPGHINLCAEATAGLRVADGVVVVIDACEGVMLQTERVVREAVSHNLPISLVVNKMDRLITELKLPPNDAFYKIKHEIGRLNKIILESWSSRQNLKRMKAHNEGRDGGERGERGERGGAQGDDRPTLLSPTAGNVCFASTRDRWMFTLHSFAIRVYSKKGRVPKPTNSKSKNQRRKETKEDRARREARARSTIHETSSFAKRLWGDWYTDPKTNKMSTTPPKATGSKRTFVQYVLEPLWKMYGNILSSNPERLKKTLESSLGLRFTTQDLSIDPKSLLRLVMRKWMGEPGSTIHSGASGFVDMCVNHIRSPVENARRKISDTYKGTYRGTQSEREGEDEPVEFVSHLHPHDIVLNALNACDANGPLMINVVKMYSDVGGSSSSSGNEHTAAAQDSFASFGRVMSGTVRVGQRVRVLGERYSESDDLEDMAVATVESVSLSQGRYVTEVTAAPAGCWVMLRGIDRSISYTATVCDASGGGGGGDDGEEGMSSAVVQPIFSPLEHATVSTIRISLEPRVPAELPKMVTALRMVCKSYPLLRTRVEESGEHVVLGTGELHLDSALHDLRTMYTVDAITDEGIEIKLSDPVVSFCETVSETSKFQCTSETPNGQNRISVLAEPLERGLAEDVEAGIVGATGNGNSEDQHLDARRVSKFLRKQHGWDALSVRSIWAFGPDARGPNVLLDDTLSVDKKELETVRGSIVQGFRWGCREGPLCDEPMRSCKFRVVDATLASEGIYRGGGQIIPAARRAMYSAFLVAEPRLLEPIYHVEIFTPEDCMEPCKKVLERRRGHIVRTAPKAGTPYHVMYGYVPGMDSFGFETDLRSHTQGQAYVVFLYFFFIFFFLFLSLCFASCTKYIFILSLIIAYIFFIFFFFYLFFFSFSLFLAATSCRRLTTGPWFLVILWTPQ